MPPTEIQAEGDDRSFGRRGDRPDHPPGGVCRRAVSVRHVAHGRTHGPAQVGSQSLSLADVLVPAGTDPWPESIAANRFGPGRDRVALTRVDPTVVAEGSVDAAQQGGVWRHPLRFVRHRPELHPADLPELPDT